MHPVNNHIKVVIKEYNIKGKTKQGFDQGFDGTFVLNQEC